MAKNLYRKSVNAFKCCSNIWLAILSLITVISCDHSRAKINLDGGDVAISLTAPTYSLVERTWVAPISVTIIATPGSFAFAAIVTDGQPIPNLIPGVNSQLVNGPIDLPPGTPTVVAVSALKLRNGSWAVGPASVRHFQILVDGKLGMPGTDGMTSAISPVGLLLDLVNQDTIVEVSSRVGDVSLGTVPVETIGYHTAFARVRLSPDGVATDVRMRVKDSHGREAQEHRLIRWSVTRLDADNSAPLIIPSDASVLLAVGSGGDTTVEITPDDRIPGGIFQTVSGHPVQAYYDKPGKYTAIAKTRDGTEIGRRTIMVVVAYAPADDEILCETKVNRPYRIIMNGVSGAAGEVTIGAGQNDELWVSNVVESNYGKVLDFTLTPTLFPADRLRYPTLVVRIPSTGAIIMAKKVSAFQIEAPQSLTVDRVFGIDSFTKKTKEKARPVDVQLTQRPYISTGQDTLIKRRYDLVDIGTFLPQSFSVTSTTRTLTIIRPCLETQNWWDVETPIRVTETAPLITTLNWQGNP